MLPISVSVRICSSILNEQTSVKLDRDWAWYSCIRYVENTMCQCSTDNQSVRQTINRISSRSHSIKLSNSFYQRQLLNLEMRDLPYHHCVMIHSWDSIKHLYPTNSIIHFLRPPTWMWYHYCVQVSIVVIAIWTWAQLALLWSLQCLSFHHLSSPYYHCDMTSMRVRSLFRDSAVAMRYRNWKMQSYVNQSIPSIISALFLSYDSHSIHLLFVYE